MQYEEWKRLIDNRRIVVLGQEYKIYYSDKLNQDTDADSDFRNYEIRINDKSAQKDFSEGYLKEVLRHEIIHCFLRESGLDCQIEDNKSWVHNEGMIDWFSIQWPKINKIFKELDIM